MGGFGSTFSSQTHMLFMAIAFTLSVSLLLIQHVRVDRLFLHANQSKSFMQTFVDQDNNSVPSAVGQHMKEIKPAPKPYFDCSIYWLRLPKTASTSVTQSFIQPIYKAGRFINTELGPNSCIEGVGGCAPYWKGLKWNSTKLAKKFSPTNIRIGEPITAPKYIGSNNSTRCYPMDGPDAPKLMCAEYDARTMIMNFGPHRRPAKKGGVILSKQLPTLLQAKFDFGPVTATHVGLDPSLFGWIMPKHPMVFSTFREPVSRLLSSFHYGIQFGGGKPGEVEKCDLPGAGKGRNRVDRWNAIVVKAREAATLQHNWTEYQSLLRVYLDTCIMAADNAYVQFLDPYSKDVKRAIFNLEKYVIVGLQTDLENTMKRWINITKSSCKSHAHYKDMDGMVFQKILNNIQRNGGFDRKRESTVNLKHKNPHNSTKRLLSEDDVAVHEDDPKSTADIKLASPEVNKFDDDLQKLIQKLTEGDVVVYERVLELYEEQRNWGL